MNTRARFACGVVGAFIVVILAWVSGFDFNERGAPAFAVTLCSVGFFIIGVTCPAFDSYKK